MEDIQKLPGILNAHIVEAKRLQSEEELLGHVPQVVAQARVM